MKPIVLTPDEVEERLAIEDQFVEEIVSKGEMLSRSGSEVNDV